MSARQVFCAILSLTLLLSFCSSETSESLTTKTELTGVQAQENDELKEWNNQIRRDKFDLVLPHIMKKNNIDMWIHVMREVTPSPL